MVLENKFFKVKLRISGILTDCWVPISAKNKEEVLSIMKNRNKDISRIDIQTDVIIEIDQETYKRMLNKKLC